MSQWDGIVNRGSGASSGSHVRTPNVSSHLQIGRASRPGPLTGGYMVLTSGPSLYDVASVVQAAWAVPFDAKILAFGSWRRSTSGVSARTLTLYSSTDGTALSIAHSVDYNLVDGVFTSTTTPLGLIKTDKEYVNRGEDFSPVDSCGIYGFDLPAKDHTDNRLNNSNASAIHIGSTHPWIVLDAGSGTATMNDGVHYVVLVPTSHANANPAND